MDKDMPPHNWETLKDLFERALDCESPEERRAFLSASCGDDQALREELESLLAEHGRMSTVFLEQPPVLELRQEANLPSEGSMLGPYRLERRLGRGGMGTVYLAARADGAYEKKVAIKLVSAVGAPEEIVRRFLEERQILAGLDHPNIARLVDGGTTAQGQPYLVLDYVDGIPIDRYCRERSLGLDQRLALFQQVCRAVAYAHEKLVVHRDIKPGNILVTADGTPKLLDFGIAKLLHPDNGDSDSRRTLLILGTPEYCSPEQVSGRTISEATDVYSLGVLLYELLTERSPYQVVSRAAHEMARVICEEDPAPPSSALGRTPTRQDGGAETPVASGDDRKRRKSLSGDLDNIVMMALRKEPEKRYRSVSDFTEDIRRHVQGLPVHARPQTWRYRGVKFVRRHRVAAAAALAVIAAVLTLVVASQGRTTHVGEVTNRRIWGWVGDSVSPDGQFVSATRRHDGNLVLHNVGNDVERGLTSEGAPPRQYAASSAFSPDGSRLAYTWQPAGDGPPPMELRVVGLGGSGLRTVFRDANWLIVHGWTDGQHVLLSSEQETARLLLVSIADGSTRTLPVSPGFRGGQTLVIASPDGRFAAYTAGREESRSTEIRLISLETGADAPLFAQPSDDSVLGWTGSRLVFSSNRSGVGGYDIWSAPMENGQVVGVPERFGPAPDLFRSLGITKTGALFYASSNDSDEVFLSDLDASSGKLSAPRVLTGRFAGSKEAPIWSPDGTRVFYVAANAIHLAGPKGETERDVQPKLRDLKRVLRWQSDGRSVFEFADGGLFQIEIDTGEARKILAGRMENAALSPDGKTLYMQGGPQSRSIVARDLATGKEIILCTRDRRSDLINARLSLSPDGKMLAMQLWNSPPGYDSLAVMPAAGGEPRVLQQVSQPEMWGAGAIEWSPDGRYVYAASTSGLFQFGFGHDDHSRFWRFRLDSGLGENSGLSVEGTVRHLHLSPDGRQIVFQSHRSTGETWALENFLPRPARN